MSGDTSYMKTPEYREKIRQANLRRYAREPMSQEIKDKISASNSGKVRTEEHCRNISLAKKGQPSPLKGMLGKGKGVKRSEETKRRISEGRKKMFREHPEAKDHLKGNRGARGIHYIPRPSLTRSINLRGKQNSLGTHHRSPTRSSTYKRKWKDPKYVEMITKAQGRHPNNAEMELYQLLEELYPHEFAYNGDFSLRVLLNGKCPDFVNVNGKKQVIEYFGGYWHNEPDEEANKIQAYSEIGWRCLVIWDYEMKNKLALTAKICEFVEVC